MHNDKNTGLRATLCALILLATATATAADARGATYSLDIPSQNLRDALQALALASKHKLFYLSELVDGRTSPALKGEFTTEEALRRLLSGTNLSYELTVDGLLLIRAAEVPGASTSGRTSAGERIRLAEAAAASPQAPAATDIPAEPSSKVGLEEIIVTATKRQERAQDVPISIAVIGGEDIERRGLVGMEDYLRSIPGVAQIDNGPLNNTIIIRGITTAPTFESLRSTGNTVATYFDETPITGGAGLGQGGIDIRPVDIERIEVLRGPQGTAYGSSSLGGTLRVIPAKPKLDAWGGKVSASYSDTAELGSGNAMLQGVINLPLITDKLAIRAVGYRYDESGLYRNIAGNDPVTVARAQAVGLGDFVRGYTQSEVGQIVSEGGRLAALWQPTENLQISATYLTQTIEQDGMPVETAGKFTQAIMPIAPTGRVRGEAGEVADTELDLANVVVSYDLGWADWTTALSRVDSGSAFAADLSRTFLMPFSQTGVSDFSSFTAETRLASQFAGRWRFLAGLFYEDLDNDYQQTIDWPGSQASNPFATNPALLVELSRPVDQRAIFGEVSYDLTEKLTATIGGRYFNFDKGDRTLIAGAMGGTPLDAGALTDLDTDQNDTSFKANLSYKPTADSLLYATWAQGFRLGRPDPGAIPSTCDLNGDGTIDGTNVSLASTRNIESDSLDNYELGAKLALLDRRILIETAVYHIKWDGLPATVFVSDTCGYTANASSAESNGMEFQASLYLMKGLRFDFGGGYTQAKLTEDSSVLFAGSGDRLPGSPKVNANLAAQYEFDLIGHRAFVRADSMYYGKFYSSFAETPGLDAGDYVRIDARFGVELSKLSVEVFVRNLTNDDAVTWREPLRVTRLRPRTIGLQLGYSFQ